MRALCILLASAGTSGLAEAHDDPVSFGRDVLPILTEHCFACHGPDEGTREGDLRLDRREHATADLGGYAAIVPGEPDASELVLRVSDDVDPMPPPGTEDPLTAAQVDVLVRWVASGAPWEQHWSLAAPARPTPPPVADGSWPANAVDNFVLARLERGGIAPSPEADRVTLARRLSLDLRGLPPTPAEVDAFTADDAPGAWTRLVDRLLASPHHGERMAQHWLDLVRYGDSGGYHSDNPVPMSPYRDWVIRAFNQNMPFDRFTVAQIAGDLLPDATVQERVASGYNRLNKTTEEGGAQPGEYLHKYMADRVRTTAGVWLGLTFGCAECHDHKYDPVSTREFYAFGAFFADIDEVGVYERMGSRRPPELEVDSPDGGASALTLITAAVEPREVRLLPRGDWLDDSGPVVLPDVPASLPPLGVEGRRATRLDLARWLVSGEHPLAARVHVNRLWALAFGAGLATPLDDLGVQGAPPTHPELLDWLATELVASGWDQRHVLRLLVSSRAYRQSSLPRPDLAERDPANTLLARQSRWRVDAEFVRDGALAVSGLLDRRIGGESVFPYQPRGYWQHLNFPKRRWKDSDGQDQYRRGLYTHRQRTFPHPSLLAFDAPTREECAAQRPESNTPLQALVLLNDPTYVEAARALALRTLDGGGEDDGARMTWAFREAVQRTPEDAEVAVLLDLLARHSAHYAADPRAAEVVHTNGLMLPPPGLDLASLAAWTSVARTLLNLDEAITRP